MLKPLLFRLTAAVLISAVAPSLFSTCPSHANGDLGSLEDLLPPSTGNKGPRSHNGRVQIFNSLLIHPMPVWSRYANGPAPAEKTKFKTANRNGIYYLDMVPKDESFKQWTNRFSVVGFDQANASLRLQSKAVVGHFRSQCSPSNMQVFGGKQAADRAMLVIACGAYSRNRGTGQMAAVLMLKNPLQSVTIMREWRGPAFQSQVASSWPVPKRELDGVLGELFRSRLLPRKKR